MYKKGIIMLNQAQATLISHEIGRDSVDSALVVKVRKSKSKDMGFKSGKFRSSGV